MGVATETGDLGRAPAAAARGRGAAARRGPLHGRHRPGAATPATPRSSARSSRTRGSPGSTPRPALELPGVVGVLTGADVAAMSRPFPVGVDGARPYYAAAAEVARYAGEPLAVVVARDRYVAEDALELIEVEYEPLEPVLDPERGRGRLRPLVLLRRPGRGVRAGRPRRRERFHFPRWSGTPGRVLRRRRRLERGERRRSPRGRTSRAPSRSTRSRPARSACPGSKLRLITPPDSGGSFGIKATVYVYVVLIGLASRKLGVPVRWTEDRLEHLAGSSASTARITDRRGRLLRRRRAARARATTSSRTSAPTSARPSRRRSTGCTARCRAPTACANVAAQEPRRADEPLPDRAQPRLRRPAALPRARADDGDRGRGGSGSTRPSCARRNLSRADEFPYRTPSGGLYDSGDYEACLDDALELARYEERRDEQAARARARAARSGSASPACVEPSISNMGYITLAQTAEERAEALPKSGNAEGATVIVSPLGGITVRIGTTPQGQGHATVAAQVVADALGVEPGGRRGPHRGRHVRRAPGRSPPATTRRASRASARAPSTWRRRRSRRSCARSPRRTRRRRRRRRAPRRAGVARRRERLAAAARRHRPLEPDALPPGLEPGLHETAFYAPPNLAAAGRRRPRRLLGRARLHRRRRRRRGRPRDRRRRRCSTT